MGIIKDRERNILESEVDDSSLNICGARPFGNHQLCKVSPLRADCDGLLQSSDIYWEREGQSECSICTIAACDRIEGSLRGEKERQLVQSNRFDDVLRALVGENSGYLQSLDAFIQPCYLQFISSDHILLKRKHTSLDPALAPCTRTAVSLP